MPWKECSVMDERLQFVARRLAGEGMTKLCRSSESPVKQGTKSLPGHMALFVLLRGNSGADLPVLRGEANP
jgi:hypothetical protein